MIVRPNMGSRIFWGVAGVTLLITGCSMSALAFPVGLIILCIATPLAVFSFGFVFGTVQTHFEEDGIFQRNFFFVTKKFLWADIQSGEIESANYNYTDSSGWTKNSSCNF